MKFSKTPASTRGKSQVMTQPCLELCSTSVV